MKEVRTRKCRRFSYVPIGSANSLQRRLWVISHMVDNAEDQEYVYYKAYWDLDDLQAEDKEVDECYEQFIDRMEEYLKTNTHRHFKRVISKE